MTIAKFTEG